MITQAKPEILAFRSPKGISCQITLIGVNYQSQSRVSEEGHNLKSEQTAGRKGVKSAFGLGGNGIGRSRQKIIGKKRPRKQRRIDYILYIERDITEGKVKRESRVVKTASVLFLQLVLGVSQVRFDKHIREMVLAAREIFLRLYIILHAERTCNTPPGFRPRPRFYRQQTPSRDVLIVGRANHSLCRSPISKQAKESYFER